MRTPEPVFIAIEEFLWLKADGSEVKLTAKIGAPYKTEGGIYRCPSELEGLDKRNPDFAGTSSMQALCLATYAVFAQLAHLLEKGERLVYVNDPERSAWDLESLNATFGRTRTHAEQSKS